VKEQSLEVLLNFKTISPKQNAAAKMNWTNTMRPAVAPDVVTSRHKHGNVPMIGVAVWILIGVASALVTLRVCHRVFRGRLKLWSDDYFLFAALVRYPSIYHCS
jgi:hypothetical protein